METALLALLPVVAAVAGGFAVFAYRLLAGQLRDLNSAMRDVIDNTHTRTSDIQQANTDALTRLGDKLDNKIAAAAAATDNKIAAAAAATDNKIAEILVAINTRFDGLDAQLLAINTRINEVDTKIDRVSERLNERLDTTNTLVGELSKTIGKLEGSVGGLDARVGTLETRVGKLETDTEDAVQAMRSAGQLLAR